MAQPSLAALYKRFMKGQDITGMEAQREADIRFLRMTMPGMQKPHCTAPAAPKALV